MNEQKPYYMIERTDLWQPHWAAWLGTMKEWVPEAHRAIHYGSREDAEEIAAGIRENLPMLAHHIVVTEHLDFDRCNPP